MAIGTRARSGSARGARAAVAGAGIVAGVIAGVLAERRHLRAIARDDAYLALSAPLGGSRLEVCSADGTELNALVFDADHSATTSATVVLAHGWTERLQFWGPVITLLRTRGLRAIAYDLRGHGDSGRTAGGDYSIERFGDDVEAVLAAAAHAFGSSAGGGPSATVIAGHSLGAMSIAAWAARHDVRARVAGAALINTGMDDLIGSALVLGQLARRLSPPRLGRALLGSAAPLPPLSSPVEQAVIRRLAFGPTATRAQIAFYERMLLDTPVRVRAAAGVAMSNLNLLAALQRLTVPTLVIASDLDRLTPPAHATRIAQALPDPVGVTVLERTGHMSPLERPELIADALIELSARVTGGAAVAVTA